MTRHLSGPKPYSQRNYEKVITGEAHLQSVLQDEEHKFVILLA
jgi:hypothetical protein